MTFPRLPASERLRIVVLGYLVRGPLGGLAWHHLQYVLGLSQLGHEVLFIEASDNYPSCYHPASGLVDTDPADGLSFATLVFERLGLAQSWAYFDDHTGQWFGPRANDAADTASTADLVLNVSGVNPPRPWIAVVPRRVLIDTDPVFTQIRHLTDALAHEEASQHTHFFTFGENIPQGRSQVPNDGLPWQATRQPIVLEAWPVTPDPVRARFTTVMQWDSYREREHAGIRYGMKSASFAPFEDLPSRTQVDLELALGSANAPRERLRSLGWRVVDPLVPTRDPWAYQAYIRGSLAEFGVAKHGYVISRSGWFSERSAAYLASGRPVVVQETGFSNWLETGLGVLSFGSPEQAISGIESVLSNWHGHARAARDIAATWFDHRSVLTTLVEKVMASTPAREALGTESSP